MASLPPELLPYVKFATPPVIGAVIGYVTNRVAIKMLFRPLKAWKIMGFRVPMTPGVIPSKRLELARNMGEVVGDHLLTGREISEGLQQKIFQDKLFHLIDNRILNVLDKDLGSLPSIIPSNFKIYFDLGSKAGLFKIKTGIHSFLAGEKFAAIIRNNLDEVLENILNKEVGNLVSLENRETGYNLMELNLKKMFASPEMEQWLDDFVHQKVHTILQREKSIADILPASVHELILNLIEKQSPAILVKLSTLISEPEVRDNIIKGVCNGVDKFIDSLGSMADMVRGFLKMEMVEDKVREYLIEKNDDIIAWLQSEKVQKRVAEALAERSSDFMAKPIVSYIKTEEDVVDDFCSELSRQILLLLNDQDVVSVISAMIRSNVETYIDSGNITLREFIEELFGEHHLDSGREWLKDELLAFFRSERGATTIDSIIDNLAGQLLNKKIGKLSRIIPAVVRTALAKTLQKLASSMLASEVPGLVQTLNIRNIVTEKVNSLDLLKLEGLLLTIMEEQFKYINLFGALLGFIIGCLNLFFLYGL
ncbi:DUF445 family protein [Desulfomarina sp.]